MLHYLFIVNDQFIGVQKQGKMKNRIKLCSYYL
jgi:hypothetical protein